MIVNGLMRQIVCCFPELNLPDGHEEEPNQMMVLRIFCQRPVTNGIEFEVSRRKVVS